MTSYYCIVNMIGVAVREIAAFEAADDSDALRKLKHVASQWPGFETIALYEGERLITVLANPSLGFPQDALPLDSVAA